MIEDYYKKKAISNSSLSKLNPNQMGNPLLFWDFLNNNLEEDRADHFIVGTEIHKIILEPEKLQVIPVEFMPSESIKNILDDAADQLINSGVNYSYSLETNRELIMDVANKFKYQVNWKEDTRFNKIKEKGENYFYDILYYRSRNMDVISQESKAVIDKCVSSLQNNETAKYLINEDELRAANPGHEIEIYNELELFWDEELNGEKIPCKAKLDRVIVDFTDETYFIVDLKSTGKPLEAYKEEYDFRRHYRQNAFYHKGLFEFLYKEHNKVFQLGAFYNVVVEKKGYYRTGVFKTEQEHLDAGTKEYRELLELYLFHLNHGFLESKEEILNNGILKLNLYE